MAFFVLLYFLFIAGLLAFAAVSLWWMIHIWTSPRRVRNSSFASGHISGRPLSFSLLVPARHEEAVLAQTLTGLARLRYPDYEVIAIVGHDDPATMAVAERVAAQFPSIVKVVVDPDPGSKPGALNAALSHVGGEVLGIFDAEDEVHPDLLTKVDREMRATGADVVQSGVQLMNHDTNWFALRNVLEYYFHFRSRLHRYSEMGLVPLGGNTVFARTAAIRATGGWDTDCLAEDCDLGIRLSSLGARIAICYDADLVTREEAPSTIRSFFRQRTRWNQGFLQVLRKREWANLPSQRQRLIARLVLAMPFLQAFTGVAVVVALVTVLWLRVPVSLALFSFTPLIPLLATVVVEAVALHEFCRTYGRRATVRDYVRLIVGAFPYQMLLAAAAVRAVLRERRGDRGWEKTEHHGLHRQPTQLGRAA
jgi:cellulose synthase/poly-beta-1,6-N-acetylglucosamine synthase-like glycosyltransferase